MSDSKEYCLELKNDVFGDKSYDLKLKLLDLVQEGYTNIVLDFKHVNIIDSIGLGILLKTQQSLRGVNGQLSIENASSSVRHLLEVTYLHRQINIL
jgi:anti-anti-sigma factor